MLSLSPSKLRDFLTCPQLYKLRHLDRLGADANTAALSFGRSIHAALEELHKIEGAPWGPLDPEHLLTRHWEAGAYSDKQESDSYFAKGCAALRRYAEGLPNSPARTLGVEVFLSRVVVLPGLRFRLACKADRISVDQDGVLEVLDYKTNISGRLPTAETLERDLPNFIYYVLSRTHYPDYPRIRVAQLNVLALVKVGVEYAPEQVAANKKNLIAQVRACASGDFGPKPCDACAWCPVQDNCQLFGKEIDLDSI